MQQDTRYAAQRASTSALSVDLHPFIYPPAHGPAKTSATPNQFRHSYYMPPKGVGIHRNARSELNCQCVRTHDRSALIESAHQHSLNAFMHHLASRFAPLLSRVSHAPWHQLVLLAPAWLRFDLRPHTTPLHDQLQHSPSITRSGSIAGPYTSYQNCATRSA